MKIVTSFDYPPIPERCWDWSAIDADNYDGAEDSHPRCQVIGRGPTEQAAIDDLMDQISEMDAEEADQREAAESVK